MSMWSMLRKVIAGGGVAMVDVRGAAAASAPTASVMAMAATMMSAMAAALVIESVGWWMLL